MRRPHVCEVAVLALFWIGGFHLRYAHSQTIGSRVSVVVDEVTGLLQLGDFEKAFTLLSDFAHRDGSALVLNNVERSEILFFMGTAKHGNKEYEVAVDYYQKALELRPDMPGAWKNLAILCKDNLRRYDVAERAYRRALELDPTSATTPNSLGHILNRNKQYSEAAKYLEIALENIVTAEDVQDIDSLYTDIYFNLGVAYMNIGRVQDALRAYYAVVGIDPNHAAAQVNLASLYHKAGQFKQAIEMYRHAIDAAKTSKTWMRGGIVEMSQMNLGHALAISGSSRPALDAFAASRRARAVRRMSQDYVVDEDDREDGYDNFEITLLAHEVRTRRTVCDWRVDRTDLKTLLRDVAIGTTLEGVSPALLPFDTLILPVSPAFQRDVAVAWSAQYLQLPSLSLTKRRGRRKVRVGFLSYDFNDHPTAHMIEGIFKGDSRIESTDHQTDHVAISFGKEDGSVFRKEIRNACEGGGVCSSFMNVAMLSHADAALAIVNANIDILLDLQAHTLGSRQEILARKPAPIAVSFLVYPGTMGSKWIDYLVADRFVAPPELAAHYTESLVYFPDSYQINYYPSRDLPPDLQGRLRSERSRGAIRSITKEALQDDASDSGAWLERFRELPTSVVLDDGSLPRAAHGLASDVVFCNFNKIQKFDRTSFALWLAILRRVPRSVLWLLKPSTRHEVRTVQYNLEAEARSMGIHVSRIVWAPRVPKLAHLARHRHATLFLDTLIYNAHSTASDALRGGLPVITTPKRPFAGRVAAALLRAVGLPELIASDVREYEDLAVRLARSPHLIDGLRRRLRDAGELPLFDELQYRKHFERAMTLMWESKHAGQSGHVVVAPGSSRVEGP